jgi:hypothetical protein
VKLFNRDGQLELLWALSRSSFRTARHEDMSWVPNLIDRNALDVKAARYWSVFQKGNWAPLSPGVDDV